MNTLNNIGQEDDSGRNPGIETAACHWDLDVLLEKETTVTVTLC